VKGAKTTGIARAAALEPPGDGAAHAALFERVVERIHRYFKKMVFDAGEAEECTQRALLALERSLREGRYDPARSWNAWMWMKAHSVFVDWCRERGRRHEPLPDEALPAAGDDIRRIDERLDAEAVLRAVERRLGTETYEIFVLRYQGGLTMEEVAETVGRDRKTVAARLKAAHALAERLLGGGRA